MAQSKLYPVVMAGGSGSRLWPLSRVLYPKQFLCLKGDLTMLQTTICRLNGVECESPVVICNEQHRFIVAEQLRQLNKLTENIILEPAGRNTAPAIALAALAAKRHSPESDPLMLVLAADHVIADEDAFRAAVRNAMPYAEAGKLVTFGIVPDLPETGYGYIRRGEVSAGEQDTVAFEVAQFVEKTESGNRPGLCGKRRILLEQRHVPVPRRTLSRRTEKISPGYPRCLRKSDERRRSGSRFYSRG